MQRRLPHAQMRPMDHDELNRLSKRAADWVRDYHAGLRDRPVRAQTEPGAVAAALPAAPPEAAENTDTILADFQAIVPGAMTHWQHPRFFAYFNTDASPASMLAEQLANAMAVNGMLWQTSPAATEMEEVIVQWLRQAFGLRAGFTGTIHGSATEATLCAVLTMRERALGWSGIEDGLSSGPRLRIYASAETHSSVDKAVRIAGIGQNNLVKIATRDDNGMDPGALDAAIRNDLDAGFTPAGVVICAGGTSIGAFDPVAECVKVARAHDLWTHVDAAWAGNFMVAPEFRHLWAGVDDADSIVVNPYKGLGVQFDGAVQFLADPGPQIRTLGMQPEYLRTLGQVGTVTDFNDWTVPLGRRFRALKIWFVLRAYGLEGLRTRKRNHVAWCAELAEIIRAMDGIEIITEPVLGLFTFAMRDDKSTKSLLQRINDDGTVYLTQTRHQGRFVIRVAVGTFDCTRDDVMCVAQVLRELAHGPKTTP